MASGALGVRLYDWHVRQAEQLAKEGSVALFGQTQIEARRGTIYDRRGDVFAISRRAYLVAARPPEIRDRSEPRAVADRLAPLIGMSPEAVAARISTSDFPYVKLARGVSGEVGAAIETAVQEGRLPGVYLEPDRARVYPNQGLAAHILGFLGESASVPGLDSGQAGIESYYDQMLGGKPGTVSSDRDREGRRIPLGRFETVPPRHGSHLVLTIDRTIQHIAEQELEMALNTYNAEAGNIVITDPSTGEVLALASRPSYVPSLVHTYPSVGPEFLNRVIGYNYEPGSTFKLITMAAGLDSDVITPEATHNLPGIYEYYGQEFKNWDERTYPNQTMVEVLRHSSNTGAIAVADAVGANRFYDYVNSFGFGLQTGIDLSGEEAGIVRRRGDRGWFLPDLAANSFGQGISVTPIQLAMAIGAIANGGLMMRPHIARAIVSPNGARESIQPEMVRRVISARASQTLIQMMEAAEAGIEENLARIPGYRTAGKTGTAEIPVGGVIQPDVSNASYVGFGPLELPRVLALITIEKPQTATFGSQVASPTFRRLMERVFAHLKIPARDL